jgi:DNA-binding response OmpR family regulator
MDGRFSGERKMTICGTILVVDHDDATRAAAVSAVARLGLRAQAVATAELVLDQPDAQRPTLAIVEVELPGPVSGLELLRELHAAHGEHLPVILVSAERTAPLDHVAGLLLGADDYVAKPFDEGELLARVRRSLSRAAGPSANGNGNGNGTTTRPGTARRSSARVSSRSSSCCHTGSVKPRSHRASSSARRPSGRTSSTSSRSSACTAAPRRSWRRIASVS